MKKQKSWLTNPNRNFNGTGWTKVRSNLPTAKILHPARPRQDCSKMTNYEKYIDFANYISINSSTEKSKENTHVKKLLTNLKPPNKPNTNVKDKIDF